LPKVVKVCVFYSGIIAITVLGAIITKEIINTKSGGQVKVPIPAERIEKPATPPQYKITPEITELEYIIKQRTIRSQLVEIFRMVLDGTLVLTDGQIGEIIKQANDDKDGTFEELAKSLNLSKLEAETVIKNNTKFEKYISDVILSPEVGNYPSNEKLGKATRGWMQKNLKTNSL
jgi:hypothetical protein